MSNVRYGSIVFALGLTIHNKGLHALSGLVWRGGGFCLEAFQISIICKWSVICAYSLRCLVMVLTNLQFD